MLPVVDLWVWRLCPICIWWHIPHCAVYMNVVCMGGWRENAYSLLSFSNTTPWVLSLSQRLYGDTIGFTHMLAYLGGSLVLRPHVVASLRGGYNWRIVLRVACLSHMNSSYGVHVFMHSKRWHRCQPSPSGGKWDIDVYAYVWWEEVRNAGIAFVMHFLRSVHCGTHLNDNRSQSWVTQIFYRSL